MIHIKEGQIEVKVLADSISEGGARLTTFELLYPRFIHSEFMTHRLASKNAASSRAIPSNKLLDIVENDPVLPVSIGKNQAGMQASQELDSSIADKFIEQWTTLAKLVANGVKGLQELGAHKQIVNRPLEAYLPIRVVTTGTDWENFFFLRNHHMAQPEFQVLARLMKQAMDESVPVKLANGEWHLPYITTEDTEFVSQNYEDFIKAIQAVSVARCARVSHALGGLSAKSIQEEVNKGFELMALRENEPSHLSPLEHIATPWNVSNEIIDPIAQIEALAYWLSTPNSICPTWADVKNFRGWRQLRSFIEHKEIVV